MLDPIRPYSPEWHAARQHVIGASDVAALYGLQAEYQPSLYALWQVKSGRIPRPEVNGERPKWGLRLEAFIGAAAAEENGWTIEPGGWVRDDATGGRLAATLDFRIVAPEPAVLETKNADWLIHKRQWGDEPPAHVALQLQAQLACSGLAKGYIACLVGGNDLKLYPFEARPKVIADMRRRVAEFWRSIEAAEPPPVDGTRATADALAELYPVADPALAIDVTMDEEFQRRAAALKQARLDGRAAEAAERAAANWIMHRMGAAERAEAMDEVILTAKTVNRKAYAVKESSYRKIELKETA